MTENEINEYILHGVSCEYITPIGIRNIEEKGIPILYLLLNYYKRKYWYRFWKKVRYSEMFTKITNKEIDYILIANLIHKYIEVEIKKYSLNIQLI